MKNKFTLILSLTLIVLMCFASCSRVKSNDDTGDLESNSQNDNAQKEMLTNETESNRIDNKSENENSTDKTNGETVSESVNDNTPVLFENGDGNTHNDKVNTPQKVVVISNSFRYLSPEELQSESDLIFIGEYTGQSRQVMPDENVVDDINKYKKVYTDYTFKPISIGKGDMADEIFIRCAGGIADGVHYACQDTPNFEEGKRYLIYARLGSPIIPNDADCYYIITTHCFEIDESGTVDFSGVNAEDIPQLQAQYDAAVGSVTQDK